MARGVRSTVAATRIMLITIASPAHGRLNLRDVRRETETTG
jgi:hypothetical protein